jgi:predicted NAD/FAD-binding protein
VSLVHDTASRFVIEKDVESDDLERAVAAAQREIAEGSTPHPAWRTPVVCITRSDWTYEARRAQWFEDFYDRDKNGRKLRRYKKPQIEREWEQWVKDERKATAAAAKAENDQYDQRRRGVN